MWHCKCDCGNEKDVLGTSLRYGATISCGCVQRQRASQLDESIRIRDSNNIITHNEKKRLINYVVKKYSKNS